MTIDRENDRFRRNPKRIFRTIDFAEVNASHESKVSWQKCNDVLSIHAKFRFDCVRISCYDFLSCVRTSADFNATNGLRAETRVVSCMYFPMPSMHAMTWAENAFLNYFSKMDFSKTDFSKMIIFKKWDTTVPKKYSTIQDNVRSDIKFVAMSSFTEKMEMGFRVKYW